MLENPAVFTPVPYCEMTEVEFMSRLDEATSGGVLVDLHNLYTNERNGGTPAHEWLEALPVSAPVEVHLAGGSELFGFYTDSHANPTPQPVWDLADEYVHRWPNVRASSSRCTSPRSTESVSTRCWISCIGCTTWSDRWQE